MLNLFKQKRTLIMGVLNVTPDSFSDGGRFLSPQDAIYKAKQMIDSGADIIDIGGESSRPGSEPVSTEEELNRVLPVIKALASEVDIHISIDTYKPEVAKEALQAGVTIINDITGLSNPAMIDIAAKYQCPVVIMHMQGKPKTMQDKPVYDDVIKDIKQFFSDKIEIARKAGVTNIIIDPGIGFGKTLEHNLQILKYLQEFKSLNCPVLIGVSRKSFIGNLTGALVGDRLEETIAATVIAIMNGANIVRVHDVKECHQAVQVADAIKKQ